MGILSPFTKHPVLCLSVRFCFRFRTPFAFMYYFLLSVSYFLFLRLLITFIISYLFAVFAFCRFTDKTKTESKHLSSSRYLNLTMQRYGKHLELQSILAKNFHFKAKIICKHLIFRYIKTSTKQINL